jgi:hypothetical protein
MKKSMPRTQGKTPMLREQLWFWTPEWQSLEKEAEEDLSAGRFKEFKSGKKAIAWLKS